MVRPSCKELILDAAESVVVEEGPGRMTLDAVAASAGVSKGGLLYHFPSKEALLEGMVARHILRARVRIADQLKEMPEDPTSALAAEVRAGLMRTEQDTRVGSALLAAVSNERKLLDPVVDFKREQFARLAAGVSREEFARRALVLLSVEGLLFLDLLQIAPFSAVEREALATALLRMVDESSEGVSENVKRSTQ